MEKREGNENTTGNCSDFKMTKKIFKTLMNQVNTVHERLPNGNKFYGVQNGRYFPVYDKRRHNIDMALFLGNRLKDEMFNCQIPRQLKSNKELRSLCIENTTSNDTKRLAKQMSALSIGPTCRLWKPSRSTPQMVNPNESISISNLPITSRVSHNAWIEGHNIASVPRKCYSPPRRKSESITFTIEEEREGKQILLSDPKFKLLFVPSYEIEEPDFVYLDPVPEDSPIEVLDEYMRGKYKGDNYIKRIIEIRRLDEDTECWEEKQEKSDFSPKYSPVSSAEAYQRSRRISSKEEKTVVPNPPKLNNQYGRKSSSTKPLTKAKDAKLARTRSAPVIHASQSQSSDKEVSNYCLTCKSIWKQSHKKKRCKSAKLVGGKLKPSKYYDIVDLATTFEPPCQEKMKSRATELPLSAQNRTILPGKCFSSQRKESLTTLKRQRPKTSSTKSPYKPKRPVTAIPVSGKKTKIL